MRRLPAKRRTSAGGQASPATVRVVRVSSASSGKTLSSAGGSEACVTCPSRQGRLQKLGLRVDDSDFVIALAGNPNTGKTTVFNALTGLRMHTGNWPGKTVGRAEGGFSYEGKKYRMIDLPGT